MLKPGEIRRLRKSNDQTLAEVGNLSDMAPETFSKIEQGKRSNITLDTLDRLAKALKVEPAELLN